jgi:hypothetical protein
MKQYIHDHPGVVITLSYIYLSFIGLMYQYFHLKAFGASLFDFSTTNDYLVAFLKAIPFLAAFIFVHILILIKDIIFNQKYAPGETFKKRCYAIFLVSRKLELILLLLALPVFAWLAGDIRGNSLSAHSLIEVEERTAKELGIGKVVCLFDTTYDYIFIVEGSSHVVLKREKLGFLKVNGSNKLMQPNAKASAD